MDTRESEAGIGVLKPGMHEDAFETLVADWPPLTAIMAGMIGSRQGWREAAYVECPADARSIAAEALRFETRSGRAVVIVPGLMLRSETRDGDVMRGEETQIAGLLADKADFSGTVLLPGTHAKWCRLSNGRVLDFQTIFSGEMFHLLSRHSFLRHSVEHPDLELANEPDFRLAVKRVVEEGLPFLSAIFSVRARSLLDDISPHANTAYLSGLVIGAEIAAARDQGLMPEEGPIWLIGADTLTDVYADALAAVGRHTVRLDGGATVVKGLLFIAREIGVPTRGEQT